MIQKWYKLTNQITALWIEEYFECKSEDVDWWWVNNDYGQVFFVGDYYISFQSVLFCLNNKVKKQDFFNWYNYSLLNRSSYISLEDFTKSPQKLKEQQEKYLEDLKQRVETAKEELEKAIKEYGN